MEREDFWIPDYLHHDHPWGEALKFAPEQQEFIAALGWQDAPEYRQLALTSVAECVPDDAQRWTRDRLRKHLLKHSRAVFKERLEEQKKYGFVVSLIVIGIALIAFETALSWAIERILDWLFPKSEVAPDSDRVEAVMQFQFRFNGKPC